MIKKGNVRFGTISISIIVSLFWIVIYFVVINLPFGNKTHNSVQTQVMEAQVIDKTDDTHSIYVMQDGKLVKEDGDNYRLTIDLDGKEFTVSVDEDVYNTINVNEYLKVTVYWAGETTISSVELYDENKK